MKDLPAAVIGQEGQYIGHHCDCNDEGLDCDLLHDITSL